MAELLLDAQKSHLHLFWILLKVCHWWSLFTVNWFRKKMLI